MALIVLASASGSPGASTAALAFTLNWPRPALLVDAAPDGASGVFAGYFRGAQEPTGGLINLALAHRDGALAEALPRETLILDAAAPPERAPWFLPGIRSHEQAPSMVPLWEPLAEQLRALDRNGQDVIVDAGRLGLVGGPQPLIAASDLTLLVTRNSLPALAGARSWATALREQFVTVAGLPRLGALLVDEDGRWPTVPAVVPRVRPYTARQVAKPSRSPSWPRSTGTPRWPRSTPTVHASPASSNPPVCCAATGPPPHPSARSSPPTKPRSLPRSEDAREHQRTPPRSRTAQRRRVARRETRSQRDTRSPFARSRATNNEPNVPPRTNPMPADDDPTSLPIFGGAWANEETRPGRARSEFSLRPLVGVDPVNDSHADHPDHDQNHEVDLDWDLVAQYRAEVSSRLTARLDKEGGRITDEGREQLGIQVIEDLIQTEAENLVSTGRRPWPPQEEKALKTALRAALFGLGRLQPLVDRSDVENIIIIASGPDCWVRLELTDGTLVEVPPIADSEDELREFLADLGSRQNRPFTEARPSLHLRLPGGARLAAASWVTADTSVVIRRHGLREVSLDEMVNDHKACGPVLAGFLAACVRAGKSIVVSGVQGSGKTTWSEPCAHASRPGK